LFSSSQCGTVRQVLKSRPLRGKKNIAKPLIEEKLVILVDRPAMPPTKARPGGAVIDRSGPVFRHAFLQALMRRGYMPESDAKELYLRITEQSSGALRRPPADRRRPAAAAAANHALPRVAAALQTGATWASSPRSTPLWPLPNSSCDASSTRCGGLQCSAKIHAAGRRRAPLTLCSCAAQGDGAEYIGFVNLEADEESRRSGRYRTKEGKPDVRVFALFRALVSTERPSCAATSTRTYARLPGCTVPLSSPRCIRCHAWHWARAWVLSRTERGSAALTPPPPPRPPQLERIAAHEGAVNGLGWVSSGDSLNLSLTQATQQPTQVAAAAAAELPRLSKAEREAALEALTEDGWLAHTPGRPGCHSLGPRAFLELGQLLLEMELPPATRVALEAALG
jgi:hypothetical protein